MNLIDSQASIISLKHLTHTNSPPRHGMSYSGRSKVLNLTQLYLSAVTTFIPPMGQPVIFGTCTPKKECVLDLFKEILGKLNTESLRLYIVPTGSAWQSPWCVGISPKSTTAQRLIHENLWELAKATTKSLNPRYIF